MKRKKQDASLTASFVTSLPYPQRRLDESRISSKGQITLPKSVRSLLGVSEGDEVRFSMVEGRVLVEAVEPEAVDDDPVVSAFLGLLEGDLATNAGAAVDFPEPLMRAMQALAEGIDVDLDAPITGEVAI